MSDNKVIPANISLAAKRAFIRTSAQGYATSLSTGISASAVITYLEGGINWTAIAIMAGVAIATPFLGGLAAYLSVVSRGIPAEYQE